MNPAWSVILFTTISGMAQGLVVALAAAQLLNFEVAPSLVRHGLVVSFVLLAIGLGASFAHLGRPERAWRAVLMWRTSWLSREVIVLPAFMASVAVWWLAFGRSTQLSASMPVICILLAGLLWFCTAKIYACIRFIQEWAQPLTAVNFFLIGMSSGLILTGTLVSMNADTKVASSFEVPALLFTLGAWLSRWMSLKHNASIRPKSTVQSATGIPGSAVQQKSMGMTGGSFNTREFFHGRSGLVLSNIKITFLLMCFALPSVLLSIAWLNGVSWPWLLALLIQVPGLLAERWFFFAQANHPQNLYYQVVS
jgi:sulfite dehydrogenase (quinone) subunit SoeC